MCCPAHTGNEVRCVVGGRFRVALLNVWPCGCCVLIVGLVAGFRWPGDPEARDGSHVGFV